MANISLIIVSHNKPDFIKEAIQGVLNQTHQDWEAVLVDSGVLLNKGHFDYLKDPRIRIIPSGETKEMFKTTNMASWCFNNVLNSGKLTGELVIYLCDDDLIYPNSFQTYWDYYTKYNREPQAMYSSQDIGLVSTDGKTQIVGKRHAKKPAGKFCRGVKMDCKVDYLQFCHTRAILGPLGKLLGTTRYHCEDRDEGFHADGIFMEQIGSLTKVHNIDVITSMNRRTTTSINLEHADTAVGRAVVLAKAKFKGLLRRLPSKKKPAKAGAVANAKGR